jgi:hypothetical protein
MRRSVWNYLGVDTLVAPFWCAIVGHLWVSLKGDPEHRTCERCSRYELRVGTGWVQL